ncbi:hypothetical protein D9M73_236560 [compost metagenome]
MTGVADRFGAFGGRQNQTWQHTGQVLLPCPGSARALAILDLPDPGGRALAQVGSETAAQFGAATAAVGQQPVTRGELVIHSPQALDTLFR